MISVTQNSCFFHVLMAVVYSPVVSVCDEDVCEDDEVMASSWLQRQNVSLDFRRWLINLLAFTVN